MTATERADSRSDRGRRLRIGVGVALVVVVVLAVAFASRFGSDPNLVPSPLIGERVPALELPPLFDGDPVDLAELDGQIVVVNFFASWCLECRTEHDDLLATADAFSDADVRVIQVAYQDAPEDARAFIEELGRSPETFYLEDPGSRAAISFGVFGVPETYFLDRDGTVVGKIQGESNALLLGETIDRIRRGEDVGQRVVGEVQSEPDP